MRIVPLGVAAAEEFLAKHDRHYKAPVEPICAIGVGEFKRDVEIHEPCVHGDRVTLHGAAILGRRADGDAELAHIYVDGMSQGYTLLYGACWRALKALGYEKTAL